MRDERRASRRFGSHELGEESVGFIGDCSSFSFDTSLDLSGTFSVLRSTLVLVVTVSVSVSTVLGGDSTRNERVPGGRELVRVGALNFAGIEVVLFGRDTIPFTVTRSKDRCQARDV